MKRHLSLSFSQEYNFLLFFLLFNYLIKNKQTKKHPRYGWKNLSEDKVFCAVVTAKHTIIWRYNKRIIASYQHHTTQHRYESYYFLFDCWMRVQYFMLLQRCQMSYGAPSTRLWRPCRLHSWVQWLINLTFELAIDYLQSLYQSPWH